MQYNSPLRGDQLRVDELQKQRTPYYPSPFSVGSDRRSTAPVSPAQVQSPANRATDGPRTEYSLAHEVSRLNGTVRHLATSMTAMTDLIQRQSVTISRMQSMLAEKTAHTPQRTGGDEDWRLSVSQALQTLDDRTRTRNTDKESDVTPAMIVDISTAIGVLADRIANIESR